MDIVCFSSDQFAPITGTSIVSLLENNRDAESIVIYYIDDGVSEENKVQTESIVKSYKRNIIFIPAPPIDELFEFKFKSPYQLGHSYMRMGLGKILPKHLDRVLCLDSDTLVLGSLKSLWSIEMGDNILAGVADCVNVKAFKNQFMLDKTDVYCNAGVFLINLKEWRSSKVEETIRSIIKAKNGNIFFVEQTLMNYVCKGKIIKLPAEYNSYTLFYALKFKNLIRWRRPTNFYTEEEVKKASTNPVIVHFTRNFYMTSRPWVEGCDHPFTDQYIKYSRLTPWKELEKDNRSLKSKLVYRIVHCIPQNLLAYIINVMYNDIRPLIVAEK